MASYTFPSTNAPTIADADAPASTDADYSAYTGSDTSTNEEWSAYDSALGNTIHRFPYKFSHPPSYTFTTTDVTAHVAAVQYSQPR